MVPYWLSAPLLGLAGWYGAFSELHANQRFVLLLIGLGCVAIVSISVVAIVCGMVQAVHRNRTEAELKRDMLDRGMSADEIARVVESSTPKDFLERWAANQGKKKPA
jgi:hypothetical protein